MKIVITVDPELTRIEQLRVIETSFWKIITTINEAKGSKVLFGLANPEKRKTVAGAVKVELNSAPPLGARTFRTISVKEEKKRAKKARKEAKKS